MVSWKRVISGDVDKGRDWVATADRRESEVLVVLVCRTDTIPSGLCSQYLSAVWKTIPRDGSRPISGGRPPWPSSPLASSMASSSLFPQRTASRVRQCSNLTNCIHEGLFLMWPSMATNEATILLSYANANYPALSIPLPRVSVSLSRLLSYL